MLSPRRILVAVPCAAFAALALAIVPAAQADVVSVSACNSNALNQVFSPWVDPAYYELAPGGDFASNAWSLSGGAQVVSGGPAYAAPGATGGSALSLPAGSSATSPSTCVNAAYPDIRFFVAGTGSVQVSVVYGDTVIPSGVVPAGGSWAPGPVTVTGSAIEGAINGGTAQVSIVLSALSGNPLVDDVYIDPWHGCC